MAISGPYAPMPANVAGGFAGTGPRLGAPTTARVINAVPRYNGLTIAEGGKSPAMLANEKAEAAWQEAMGLLQKQGPYTPGVVNQLTNRRADQTAAAEAVNAEEIRNTAATRGMDPTQALRAAQQQRQASNVAFSGDIASQAAIQNFAAETPGRMAAAQANLQRQFGGASTPAVMGGGARTAFAPQSTGYNPGAVHRQAVQQPMAWGASKLYGAKPTTAPTQAAPKPVMSQPVAPTAAANAPAPVQYGNTAFGPVSTAENARAYQNIYKYL